MEYFLLSKGEEAGGTMSLAENARNEWGGHCRFPVIVTSQGIEVADAARLGEEARKNRVGYIELQRTVDPEREAEQAVGANGARANIEDWSP